MADLRNEDLAPHLYAALSEWDASKLTEITRAIEELNAVIESIDEPLRDAYVRRPAVTWFSAFEAWKASLSEHADNASSMTAEQFGRLTALRIHLAPTLLVPLRMLISMFSPLIAVADESEVPRALHKRLKRYGVRFTVMWPQTLLEKERAFVKSFRQAPQRSVAKRIRAWIGAARDWIQKLAPLVLGATTLVLGEQAGLSELRDADRSFLAALMAIISLNVSQHVAPQSWLVRNAVRLGGVVALGAAAGSAGSNEAAVGRLAAALPYFMMNFRQLKADARIARRFVLRTDDFAPDHAPLLRGGAGEPKAWSLRRFAKLLVGGALYARSRAFVEPDDACAELDAITPATVSMYRYAMQLSTGSQHPAIAITLGKERAAFDAEGNAIEVPPGASSGGTGDDLATVFVMPRGTSSGVYDEFKVEVLSSAEGAQVDSLEVMAHYTGLREIGDGWAADNTVARIAATFSSVRPPQDVLDQLHSGNGNLYPRLNAHYNMDVAANADVMRTLLVNERAVYTWGALSASFGLGGAQIEQAHPDYDRERLESVAAVLGASDEETVSRLGLEPLIDALDESDDVGVRVAAANIHWALKRGVDGLRARTLPGVSLLDVLEAKIIVSSIPPPNTSVRPPEPLFPETHRHLARAAPAITAAPAVRAHLRLAEIQRLTVATEAMRALMALNAEEEADDASVMNAARKVLAHDHEQGHTEIVHVVVYSRLKAMLEQGGFSRKEASDVLSKVVGGREGLMQTMRHVYKPDPETRPDVDRIIAAPQDPKLEAIANRLHHHADAFRVGPGVKAEDMAGVRFLSEEAMNFDPHMDARSLLRYTVSAPGVFASRKPFLPASAAAVAVNPFTRYLEAAVRVDEMRDVVDTPDSVYIRHDIDAGENPKEVVAHHHHRVTRSPSPTVIWHIGKPAGERLATMLPPVRRPARAVVVVVAVHAELATTKPKDRRPLWFPESDDREGGSAVAGMLTTMRRLGLLWWRLKGGGVVVDAAGITGRMLSLMEIAQLVRVVDESER